MMPTGQPSLASSSQAKTKETAENSGRRTIQVMINRKRIVLESKADRSPYQFVDMLNYVDIDPSKPQGNYIMKLNNEDASFLDYIKDGDIIEIRWDQA